MKLWQTLTTGTLYLFALTARADILFLDVNNSFKEIEAAQKAAAVRGEKLIIFPDNSKNQKAIAAIRIKEGKAREQKALLCGKDMASQACGSSQEKLNAIGDDKSKLIATINGNSLKEKLAELKKNNAQLSSIVISGHDGNGHFGGENGSLEDSEVAAAFKANEPVGDGIRSMMLWGCYTANIGSSSNWKKTLPNVELIAGYDSVAPLADKPANWQYLSDVLIKEKKLTAVKDEKELKKGLNDLEGANIMNASLCVGSSYASHRRTLDLRNANSLCKGAMDAVLPNYRCYLNAEPQCPNPPADTENSALRDAYTEFQDVKHCEEMSRTKNPNAPSGSAFIRLIYFQEVKENFLALYPNYLPSLNSLLKSIQAPEGLLWGDLRKMSRADILKKLNDTKDCLSTALKESSADQPERMAVLKAIRGLQETLGDLESLAFSWIEPGARTKNSSLDAGAFSMSKNSIASERQYFETNRATQDMIAKQESLIGDQLRSSQTYQEATQKNKAASEKLNKLLMNSERTPEILTEAGKLQSELLTSSMTAAEIRNNEVKKITPQLKQFAEEQAQQPYSNSAGREIYVNTIKKYGDNPAIIPTGTTFGFGTPALGDNPYGG